MSRGQPVHPFISMLVERLKEIDLYYREGDYVPAWNIMLGTIDDIRAIHRKDAWELRDVIEKSIKMIDKQGGHDPVQSASRQDRKIKKIIEGKGRDIRQRFSIMLWEGDYLVEEGYGFHDPSKGRKSGR